MTTENSKDPIAPKRIQKTSSSMIDPVIPKLKANSANNACSTNKKNELNGGSMNEDNRK